jgi:hypothetical protein
MARAKPSMCSYGAPGNGSHNSEDSSASVIAGWRPSNPRRYIQMFLRLLHCLKISVNVTLQTTFSRPISLGVKPHLRSETIFLSDSCGFIDVGTLYDEKDDL